MDRAAGAVTSSATSRPSTASTPRSGASTRAGPTRSSSPGDGRRSRPTSSTALAAIVSEQAEPEDLLLFLDGDAFPIAPINADLLDGRPLAAVRRDENLGDRQPHPCFCLTTVGFWNEIGGDWRRGLRPGRRRSATRSPTSAATCSASSPSATSSGDRCCAATACDLDPLWFGIYGDVVYHHGAGFRRPVARRARARPETQAVRDSVTRGASCRRAFPCSAGSSARCATASPADRGAASRGQRPTGPSERARRGVRLDPRRRRVLRGSSTRRPTAGTRRGDVVIVLLLVTQNEADLLRWNIRHHLDWGIDHVAVADNNSTDGDRRRRTRVRRRGEPHARFPDFHDRQNVRAAMLDAVRAGHHVDWAGSPTPTSSSGLRMRRARVTCSTGRRTTSWPSTST